MNQQQRTDVFLTHDWGRYMVNGVEVKNHALVSHISKELQRRRLRTWFDEEQLKGNIIDQMRKGIDNASGVVVFVTERYIDKVSGENGKDNCKMEFGYAHQSKGASKMLAVVMEQSCRDASKWKSLGFVLGNHLYVDFSNPQIWKNEQMFQTKMDELYQRILGLIGKPLQQSSSSPSSSSSSPSTSPNSVSELSQFLTSLSLSQYTAVFENEGAVCVEDLKMFSEEELRTDLGVGKIHARRLFRKLHPAPAAAAAAAPTAGASTQKYVEAKHDLPAHADGLKFSKGERGRLLSVKGEWAHVKLDRGEEGYVPCAFFNLDAAPPPSNASAVAPAAPPPVAAKPTPVPAAVPKPAAPPPAAAAPASAAGVKKCKALFQFVPPKPQGAIQYVPLEEGQVVVIEKGEDGQEWWLVKGPNGQTGYVPSNYVQRC